MRKESQQARLRRNSRNASVTVQDKRGCSQLKMGERVPVGDMDAPGILKRVWGITVGEVSPKTCRFRGEEGSRYSRGRAAVHSILAPVLWSMAATTDRQTASQMPPWTPGGGRASQTAAGVSASPTYTDKA